jgi:Mce-associated membrane protein
MTSATPVAIAAGALVVAVAGAVVTAVELQRLDHSQRATDDRASALAAGRQIAVDIAEYDYRHIDQDFSRVDNEATGQFKQQFGTSAAGVRDAIVAVKAVSTAQVASAGVVNAGSRSATVVVALNRTVVNAQAPKGTTSAFGLQISLQRTSGRWLAAQVNPL